MVADNPNIKIPPRRATQTPPFRNPGPVAGLELPPGAGGMDVQERGVLFFIPHEASDDRETRAVALEAQSRALWDAAKELRAVDKLTVTLDMNAAGNVGVACRVGGQMDSTYMPRNLEWALDIASHLLRGLEPPKHPSYFGKPAPETPD
ncbi:MAG: hypothetical protein K2X80_03340 [Pseudomonadaceae bacterium]|nr:hypothetical protein [Pseudomonadaceae bacterium]